METTKASVVQAADKYFLEIQIPDSPVRIPLSEDKPVEVKSAFNKLIARIKHTELKIELVDAGEDLCSQVAKEYITQLNRDIREARAEMERRGLTIPTTPSTRG